MTSLLGVKSDEYQAEARMGFDIAEILQKIHLGGEHKH